MCLCVSEHERYYPTPPQMTHMHFVLRVSTRVNGFSDAGVRNQPQYHVLHDGKHMETCELIINDNNWPLQMFTIQ